MKKKDSAVLLCRKKTQNKKVSVNEIHLKNIFIESSNKNSIKTSRKKNAFKMQRNIVEQLFQYPISINSDKMAE